MTTSTNIDQLPQISAAFVAAANGDWRDTIQFNFAAGTTNAGQPINLTGIAFYLQVRDAAGITGSNRYINASTVNGQLINGGDAGTLQMAVAQSIMSKCKLGVALYVDIVAVGIGPDGTQWTVNLLPTPGTLTVSAGITFVGT